ncbi:class I SAM-dependent methyltransferase [Paenibacillus camelliae]|uniref:class I SAM-dependent methyltransferase n=1 Tax=Paenibacillus camelliae TaxID=512410 RepID=UPI002041471D|nr:class I SAM-dependent methyltransferase [Paenibacillus camelliae]MCM3633553.1 class I SAM-dependent methyltransferase [Paenibacillus camelliae]
MLEEKDILKINKDGWNKVAHHFFEESFDSLIYGVYSPSEEELNLLGEIREKTILEVGCGSGHTLEYLANRGARELYGIDLSTTQIETAKKVTSNIDIPITFIESSMEDITDLPNEYFDCAISIYALGWTVNLEKTLKNIFNSLKSGGVFVFSWEHPIHSSLEYRDGRMMLYRSYLDEKPVKHESWKKVPIVMTNRKISTYLNALIKAGFIIDQVIEETRIPENDNSEPHKWYSAEKAKILPPDIIIKSYKP